MNFLNLKLLLSGLFILILTNGSCSLISYPRNGIFLIPKDYVGDVIVFFDQPDGVEPEVENGLYVYKIPQDGILKVRTKGKGGIVNLHYFYVNENNERQEIKTLRITGDRDTNGNPQNKYGNISQRDVENSIYIMNAGGLGSFNIKNKTVRFTSFIVGTPKDSNALYDKMQKRITSYQRKFLTVEN